MAACSHSEAEAPLIPAVSFSRNSFGRRSARLRVRRSAPARAASSGIPNTLHKAAPCTAPSSAGSGNSQFPALPPFCAQTQTGLPAQCARQYHIIFVFRPGPCDLPRERQFLQQSTEPDHKSDFLCSQQRPQRLRCSQQDCFRARLRRSRLFKILQQHRIDIHSHAPGTPLLEQIVQPDPRRHQCKEPAVGQM